MAEFREYGAKEMSVKFARWSGGKSLRYDTIERFAFDESAGNSAQTRKCRIWE